MTIAPTAAPTAPLGYDDTARAAVTSSRRRRVIHAHHCSSGFGDDGLRKNASMTPTASTVQLPLGQLDQLHIQRRAPGAQAQ